jgi:YD repeat-containing protein
VIWRRSSLIFVLGVLSCVSSPGAAAQAPTSCLNYTTWWPDWPIPAGWWYYLPYPGTFVFLIASYNHTCPPPQAASETKPRCPAAVAGKPICLSTGNTYIEQSDVRLPGLSGGLTLSRTWNSQWPSTQSLLQVGMFGPNWRSTYEERVFVGSDNYIKYARGDGSFWSFGSNGGTWSLAAPQNVTATLASGSSYWTLTFQSGEQRLFNNTSGSLIAIIDRNGNTTQLSYDALNRLVTVTDPASRHLYFSYASPSSYLVTSVTSDVGISLSYAYDGQNRLSQVTNPDLTTLTFAYDSHSLITAVTDSSGKILESHSYDSNGRGLTSSRALGVEALTLSYPTQ